VPLDVCRTVLHSTGSGQAPYMPSSPRAGAQSESCRCCSDPSGERIGRTEYDARIASWLPLRTAAQAQGTPTGDVVAPAMVFSEPAERVALIVEDDDRAAELLRLLLESEGFTVVHAASAEDALLVAPVTRPGVEYRHVYIPAGTWFHLWTGARIDGPANILVHAPLGRPAVYVRANTALPLWPEMNYVGQQEADPMTFVVYPHEGSGRATLYEDPGDGYEHLNGFFARRAVTCEVGAGNIRVVMGEQDGAFVPARRHTRVELRGIAAEPLSVQLGKASAVWRYDPEQRRLIVDLHETACAQLIDVSMA